jgi:hypothetical protein
MQSTHPPRAALFYVGAVSEQELDDRGMPDLPAFDCHKEQGAIVARQRKRLALPLPIIEKLTCESNIAAIDRFNQARAWCSRGGASLIRLCSGEDREHCEDKNAYQGCRHASLR